MSIAQRTMMRGNGLYVNLFQGYLQLSSPILEI